MNILFFIIVNVGIGFVIWLIFLLIDLINGDYIFKRSVCKQIIDILFSYSACIGYVERTLIILIWAVSPTSMINVITAIIALKGFMRFPEITKEENKNTNKAEKVILGTLLSIMLTLISIAIV